MVARLGENLQHEWDEDPFPDELWDALQALKGHRDAGIETLTTLAERGSALAMMYLGHALTKSNDGDEVARAEKWLTRSAEGGSIEGRFQLALASRKPRKDKRCTRRTEGLGEPRLQTGNVFFRLETLSRRTGRTKHPRGAQISQNGESGGSSTRERTLVLDLSQGRFWVWWKNCRPLVLFSEDTGFRLVPIALPELRQDARFHNAVRNLERCACGTRSFSPNGQRQPLLMVWPGTAAIAPRFLKADGLRTTTSRRSGRPCDRQLMSGSWWLAAALTNCPLDHPDMEELDT